jgi:signal peptidase II
MQLGGALGNVIDRFRLGHVTDFLDFGPWPVFNLADTSIVAGVVILTWLMFQEQREHQTKREAARIVEMETADPSLPYERTTD